MTIHRPGAPRLRGRDDETSDLEGRLQRAREGGGGAVVLVGDSGAGATLLLRQLERTARADGFAVLTATGSASERAVPLAGIHQLLHPLAGHVHALPPAQRRAVSGALDGGADSSSSGFTLRSGVHGLLALASRDAPVLCVVDTASLLDDASAEIVAFCARRLARSRVLLVVADPSALFDGLDVLTLGPLDRATCELVVADQAETDIPPEIAGVLWEAAGGNPRDLLELCAAVTAGMLSGLDPVPESLPPESAQRRASRRRLLGLSDSARALLAIVACAVETTTPVAEACARVRGIDPAHLDECIRSGLVRVSGDHLGLRSALVRSGLYADLGSHERRAAHQLLADVLERTHDPRGAWHRARSGDVGPATVRLLAYAAAECARRGEHDWAARLLEEGAVHVERRPERSVLLLAAASAAWTGGQTSRARALLHRSTAMAGTSTTRGRAGLLRGEVELRTGVPAVAAGELVLAAEHLAELDPTRAAHALSLAHEAACIAGDRDRRTDLAARAEAARRTAGGRAGGLVGAAPDEAVRAILLDHVVGIEAGLHGDPVRALGPLRAVLAAARTHPDPFVRVRGSEAAFALGDGRTAYDLAGWAVADAARRGDRAVLAWAMVYRSMGALLQGSHARAAASSLEGLAHARELGQHNCVVDHLSILALVSAVDGDHATAALRIAAASEGIAARGLERPRTLLAWASVCTDLALERPADALDRFHLMAVGGRSHPALQAMATPHLVEAALRAKQRERATEALKMYDTWVTATRDEARLALSHRCHALLATTSAEAEEHFARAIDLHESSGIELDLARTEFLYASYLRRSRQPAAARSYLSEALKIFEAHRSELWAERTRAELRAAGGATGVRPATSVGLGQLTPQQQRIAELAAEGATNQEIADQLVVSPRTVEHHLRNTFVKLGIRSRGEISRLIA